MEDINQTSEKNVDKCGCNQTEKKYDQRKTVLAYLHDLTYLLCGILLVFLLLFRVVVVSGSSMKNTLINGDYILLLNNAFYSDPQRGDIVVASKKAFEYGSPIIKRVIATEGQTVIIDGVNDKIYVDGEELKEDYIDTSFLDYDNLQVTVEKGCVFVMGDNRMNSKDSRSTEIGQIDRREILGKAIFLFLPGKEPVTKTRDFKRMRGLW